MFKTDQEALGGAGVSQVAGGNLEQWDYLY